MSESTIERIVGKVDSESLVNIIYAKIYKSDVNSTLPSWDAIFDKVRALETNLNTAN